MLRPFKGNRFYNCRPLLQNFATRFSGEAKRGIKPNFSSLDEGAATTAVDKAYQDALAHVTRNSRVAYANLTYTEGVVQFGSVADAITDMGQAGKTYVTNLAGDEKTYTDTAAPIIGTRTLLYTEADNDLRKAITTADNVWRNNTAQAWGTHTAGDLVARGNVGRSLANTSNLLADASQASIAELKAQWWQNEIPNYLQWSVDIGGIETTYTNSTTANILLRTTGVKNAGITYASTVGTAIKAHETTTATARELYLSTLMTISETAAEATMRADRDKEIALADADLQKQLTGNESAHTTAVNNANSAHSTATANAEAARKSAEQAALTQLNSTLAQATKDKEASIAGAERTYDQAVASLDAQYGSESSNGDTGVEGATRRSAIKTRDAQYYAARDTSWANTLSGSTTLGTSPWTVKAIATANGQAAFSVSRANAQAAHDAAMLDAMEDWQDATSTAFFNSLVSSSNAKRDYTNSLAGHWADWAEATDGKTGEAPEVPTESMVDSIIGILNPFDTESLEKALIDTDVPPRPQPSEIRLVYDSMGIISNHTPEEWKVINEYRARGWTWSDIWYGGERDRMKEAGFHVSSGRLHEETPPSSIPSPKLPSAPIAPVQPQPLPEPAPETESSSDYDPLDVWANARIPYITDFLAGIVKSTAGDDFLLTTSSEGLILYTVGSSIIIVGSLYIAPQACASYVTTFMFGAASAVAQYWGINALGNFINPTHNDSTVEGTLQSAIFGGLFSIPGRWFRGGCFVAGTLVQVTDDEYYDDAMPVLDESSQICQELLSSDSSFDSHVTLLSRNSISVSRPIEQVRLGQKIPALNPQWRNDGPEVEDIDSDEWVKLSLVAYRSDGAIVDVELLRPIQLVRAAEISIGTRIPFTVPELNVDGTAEVIAISDCPEISSGVGVPVTGRYVTRQVDQTVRVVLRSTSGETETVEGTAIHPIWSVDRLDWVPLGELKIGECLDGQHEAYYVESLDFIQRSTSVFNIEVHGEHVYRVGLSGILVLRERITAAWLRTLA
ncbi:MAG: hypothetical protein JNK90_16955 [Planctomycetaceae bacterium]|nr:hypothetical protein [Planctomycetaceae bacterium]